MATAAPRAGRSGPAAVVAAVGWVGDGLAALWRWSLDSSHLYRRLRRLWRERFTARGRFVFLLCVVVGFAGVDTRQALVYQLFALAVGPLLVAGVLALRRPPRVRLVGGLPRRLTAGRPLAASVDVETEGPWESGNLVVSWTGPSHTGRGVTVEPIDSFLDCAPGRPGHAQIRVAAARRGRYVVPGLGASGTDPLGLLATRRSFRQPSQALLVYPRFFTLDDLRLPVGRRYQPGGIPLAASLGDSNEFVGTREYREGDPLRKIHWRSWARRGLPVVKEYQEEYFSRIALVFDTFLPRRPRAVERRGFEAGVSLVASIADLFSRSEQIVDLFAAGPDIYQLSAGRSLAYLANVLDVLACLEPCHEPPFDEVGPVLHENLAQLTTVVAVVLDWDEQREAFLLGLRELGVAVRTFIVHPGPTGRRWDRVAPALGEITLVSPDEVERRLVVGEQR
ncbi:MAG: DUF58 domain-containing protein [Acidobacteria bacterium]|nr:DUF58 domain-containing protein [Acidobacteriota bacterium]